MQVDQLMLDAHCHLSTYLDRAEMLRAATSSGVCVFGATNRPSEYRDCKAWLDLQPAEVRGRSLVGLGMHPEVAGSVYEQLELEIFEAASPHAAWISEIGLDAVIADRVSPHFGGLPSMSDQIELLERLLDVTTRRERGYSVHSRGAGKTLAQRLRAAGVTATFHWFSEDVDVARRVAELGHFFSANPAMMCDSVGREVLTWVPDDLLLLETDGPFVEWNGTRVQPADCREFLRCLSELRGQSRSHLEEIVERNSMQILDQVDGINQQGMETGDEGN